MRFVFVFCSQYLRLVRFPDFRARRLADSIAFLDLVALHRHRYLVLAVSRQ